MTRLTEKRLQTIQDRFEWLAKRHGTLTPEIVVRDARRRGSPLHTGAGFQWNVEAAAKRHWLDHAQWLIRNVRVEISNTSHVVRSIAWIHDPRARATDSGYLSVSQIRTDRDLAFDSLRVEVERVASMTRRLLALADAYRMQSEAWEMLDAEMAKLRGAPRCDLAVDVARMLTGDQGEQVIIKSIQRSD